MEKDVSWTEAKDGIELPRGRFEAHTYATRGTVGLSQDFMITDQNQVVRLAPPMELRAHLTVFDSFNGRPLQDAIVIVAAAAENEAQAAQGTTTQDGIVELSAIPAGPVELTITKPGYGRQVRAFTFPCKWNRFATEGRAYDLGAFDLHREQVIGFELKGTERWSRFDRPFSIAQGASGARIHFDDEGLADLPVVLDTIPLVIKIYYPDGHDSVRYLDGGIPDSGKRHTIDLGAASDLEVRLTFAATLKTDLKNYRPVLTVSHRDRGGDAVLVASHAPEAGVYSFLGVNASEVVVSFDPVTKDGSVESWTTKSVHLSDQVMTTCTLHVEEPARLTKFIREDETPLSGAHVELRRVPDVTSWIAGGRVNEQGAIKLPDVAPDPVALRIRWTGDDNREFIGIDLRTESSRGASENTYLVPRATDTSVQVTVTGISPSEGWVRIFGEDSEAPILYLPIGEFGRTSPFSLLRGSRGRFAVELEGLWFPSRSFQLSGGVNAIRGYRTGHAYFDALSAEETLDRIISVDFGATLAEWVELGLTSVEGVDSTRQRIQVPCGEYQLLDQSGGLQETKTLSAGGSIDI